MPARLVVSQFITLDGIVEDPGGAEHADRGGWAFRFERGPEGDRFKLEEVMAAGALLLGRVTYDGFAAAWPGRTDEVGFADKFNSMPKYVVSRTLDDPQWTNSHVLGGGEDLSAAVAALREQVAGDILVNGSIQLTRALLELGLVDELRLMVFPIVLGAGRRLFDATAQPIALRMMDSRPAGDTLIATYVPAEPAAPQQSP